MIYPIALHPCTIPYQQYEDDLGACERILKTKMPFAYIVHLRTFMLAWLMVLPFVLLTYVG